MLAAAMFASSPFAAFPQQFGRAPSCEATLAAQRTVLGTPAVQRALDASAGVQRSLSETLEVV